MTHGVPNRNWSYPTAMKFGVGRVAELAEHCKASGIARPLLVTDKALASLPITTAALDGLEAAGLGRAVFSQVDANPTERNMADGIAACLAGGHDGIIGFGGGSALDLAKMIALMAHQPAGLEVWALEDIGDWWTRADRTKILPTIAVPTTAGTGSEVGRAGVLTNSATHKKKIIWHPDLMAQVTICDPALTVGMPRFITAGTGMDALAHCLEAYCSPALSPDGAGHRAGRHAAGVRKPAAGLCRPEQPDGARPHDVGSGHGRGGVPEGAGGDPFAQPPDRCGLQHPSRHHERGGDAHGAGLQPPGHRRADRRARPIWALPAGSTGSAPASWTCAPNWPFRPT
jgi:hypothetical protein